MDGRWEAPVTSVRPVDYHEFLFKGTVRELREGAADFEIRLGASAYFASPGGHYWCVSTFVLAVRSLEAADVARADAALAEAERRKSEARDERRRIFERHNRERRL